MNYESEYLKPYIETALREHLNSRKGLSIHLIRKIPIDGIYLMKIFFIKSDFLADWNFFITSAILADDFVK